MSHDAGRRERKTFEPPPWERDRFAELARLKAGEQEREGGEEAAPSKPEVPAVEPQPTTDKAEKPKPAVVEDAKLQAMLLELSGEERSAVQEVRRAGVMSSYVLSAAGAVVTGLGIVLVFQGGVQGLGGSSMIVAVGMFVIGFAVWLGYRAGRGQGS